MEWRSLNFIRQVKFSFVFKFFAILISFLSVRFLLQYLDIKDYGLWAVVLSFLNWVIFFDLGIANGVKNKLAESLSKNDLIDARALISTGYIALFFFSLTVYILIFVLSYAINWQLVFNVYDYENSYLRALVLIILFFTLSNFTLSLINAVFNAVQRASLAVINQFLTQAFSLSVLLLLIKFTESDLHLLALGYGSSLFLSNTILSIWFYAKNKTLSPKIEYFNKDKLKPIMSLGLRFFILQITMMVILITDRFILVQLTNTVEVAKYDIIYKYFNIMVIFHTLINAPLWSMYTEAYHKMDYKWIEKTMRNLSALFGLYILGIIAMILLGEFVVRLWLDQENLNLTKSNYFFMGIMTLLSILHSILAYFTNGIGKTNLQLYTSLLGAILNIPLSIYFVNYLNMGLNGVILATTICLSLFCLFGPFQVVKEIKLLKIAALKSKN